MLYYNIYACRLYWSRKVLWREIYTYIICILCSQKKFSDGCILRLCACYPCSLPERLSYLLRLRPGNWPGWFSKRWCLRVPPVQFNRLIVLSLVSAPATCAVYRSFRPQCRDGSIWRCRFRRSSCVEWFSRWLVLRLFPLPCHVVCHTFVLVRAALDRTGYASNSALSVVFVCQRLLRITANMREQRAGGGEAIEDINPK